MILLVSVESLVSMRIDALMQKGAKCELFVLNRITPLRVMQRYKRCRRFLVRFRGDNSMVVEI
jgi:hypothetical protein